MEKLAEMYLASIWKYEKAGVERVIEALRKENPKAQFVFESKYGWFKVTCEVATVRDMQNSFLKVHKEIEEDIKAKNGTFLATTENQWLKVPSPGELPPVSDPLNKPPIDYQCPIAFDKYPFTQVWTRVKDETPEAITVYTFLSNEDISALSEASGGHLAPDVTGQLMYLGAHSKESLQKTTQMLNNMFNRFVYVIPQPKHLLYAETDAAYHVDARFMAHVNESMLTSAIFDPGQHPDAQMNSIFKAVFAKAVCLRICIYDRFKRAEVSFFGPKAQPVFHGQARTCPAWFKNAEYAPKTVGLAPPKTLSLVGVDAKKPEQHRMSLNKETKATTQSPNGDINKENQKPPATSNAETPDKTESFQDVDLLGLDPIQETKIAPAKELVPAPMETLKLMPPPPPESGKHSYEMRMLWEFVNNPHPAPCRHGSRPSTARVPGPKPAAADRSSDSSNSKDKAPAEDMLITTLDDDVGKATLIEIATETTAPSGKEKFDQQLIRMSPGKDMSVAKASTTGNRALMRRSTFVDTMCRHISRLVADLPYSKGRIRMQAELGRIYLMGANPEGLAYNKPGEPTMGWTASDISARLDTVCVSPDSVVFTKVLSLFANDIEHILGPGSSVDSDDGHLGQANPPWKFHDKGVMYEFKCQRFFVGKDRAVTAQTPFVVEVDGTRSGAFSYNIRRLADTRPPVWIHCIRRHWDARIMVSYSETEKLERAYGDFAQQLVHSMVVLPGPMTNPRFQIGYNHRDTNKDNRTFFTKVLSARVRNVGRHISRNKQSFLDVSWNRHMKLEMKPDKKDSRTGTIKATAAADNPARGVFCSWYEASVVSAQAEEAFRENESLAVGGVAAWGHSQTVQDDMFEATFGPAVKLVQKMDGVGVLIDNGQGDTMWTPPKKPQTTLETTSRFW